MNYFECSVFKLASTNFGAIGHLLPCIIAALQQQSQPVSIHTRSVDDNSNVVLIDINFKHGVLIKLIDNVRIGKYAEIIKIKVGN